MTKYRQIQGVLDKNERFINLYPMIYDLYPMIYDLYPMIYDLYLMIYDLYPTIYDLYLMIYDLYPTIYDLYLTIYDLYLTIYDLYLWFYRFRLRPNRIPVKHQNRHASQTKRRLNGSAFALSTCLLVSLILIP